MHEHSTINKHSKEQRDFHVVACGPNHQGPVLAINNFLQVIDHRCWKELSDHLVSLPPHIDERTEVAILDLLKEMQIGSSFHFTIKDI